jgi:multiple sugar transport system permease protein
MSSTRALAARMPFPGHQGQQPRRGYVGRADFRSAIALSAPYVTVFAIFFVYPIGYALWLAGRPSLYADLLDDPSYLPAVVNTLVFVGIGVNLQMFLALLLSGFFLRRRWWVRVLLAVFVLPWAIGAAQACVSIHWMLEGRWGLLDVLLSTLFGVDGPDWLDHRWLALGANIFAYTWKWLPFWTVIFLAGRMTIPKDLYDAAEVDGAIGVRRFLHVTVPLLANLYLICTLLAALWALGEFTTVYLVSGGGPGQLTEVLATLGFRYAFDLSQPALGVAAVMAVLPLLIPIVIVLMHKVQLSEVRL